MAISLAVAFTVTPWLAGRLMKPAHGADGGQPRAFEGVCPHEAQSLVNNSEFNGRILTCTVHGWVFDGRTGEGLRPEGCRLREYPLRFADGGMVEVDLAALA